VERFGFVTIPTMALAGFALIFALLAYPAPGGEPRPKTDDPGATGTSRAAHPPVPSEIEP
jgi:hypothetical protein